MSDIPEWPTKRIKWTSELLQLLEEHQDVRRNVTLEEVLNCSEQFPIKFPIDEIRCKKIKSKVDKSVLENHINSAYPLVHENALKLYAQFLLHKQHFGSTYEKEVYKNMTVLKFIERLLKQRAAMFMGRFDKYMLLNGTEGSGKWNLIGKDERNSKLKLENCLSYDEIKLSVFLSVSSFSYFINDGARKNYGKPASNRNDIQDEGVVIGLIGARLKKVGAMEYEEMVISKSQNTEQNGYGINKNSLHDVFAKFYEEPCFTYQQVLEEQKKAQRRFTAIGKDIYFDNVVFSKRIALSIDTLLMEANERAKLKNTTAFIHVVGIGLGVWKCSDHQEELFVETFGKRLQILGESLAAISDVFFSYFNKVNKCGSCKSGSTMEINEHPGVKILIGRRDPHTKLTGIHRGKLLVVSYAWDGNALPGNEFWGGKLASTGDSAAAASTQISEIHNPHINSNVSAFNVRIVTPTGLLPYGQYVDTVKTLKRKRSDGEVK